MDSLSLVLCLVAECYVDIVLLGLLIALVEGYSYHRGFQKGVRVTKTEYKQEKDI